MNRSTSIYPVRLDINIKCHANDGTETAQDNNSRLQSPSADENIDMGPRRSLSTRGILAAQHLCGVEHLDSAHGEISYQVSRTGSCVPGIWSGTHKAVTYSGVPIAVSGSDHTRQEKKKKPNKIDVVIAIRKKVRTASSSQ